MARKGKRRKKYEHKKPPIPKGLPRGLRLLQGTKRDYLYTLEYLEGCCDSHPNCRYKSECLRLFDSRCKHWWPNEGSLTNPTKKKSPPVSIDVVIPSTNYQQMIEAIECQLSKAV